jgi:DNA-binding GntR family transcriptional regulator
MNQSRKVARVETAFDNLTLWQRVYQHLHEEIRQQRLPPGTELREAALAKELGVSRGPIREAVTRLAAEGLVTVRPRHGAVVRELTVEEMVDAYQVREVLESMAMRLAVPRLTEEDLAQLEKFTDTMAACAEQSDIAKLFEANVAFHELICQLSGNKKLMQVHHRLMVEIAVFQDRTLSLRGGNPTRSVTEHRNILQAAREGNAELAANLAAAHIRVPSEHLAPLSMEVGD